MAELPGKSGEDKRKARLARALRANLKRRKAQSRARGEVEADAAAEKPNTDPGKPSTKD